MKPLKITIISILFIILATSSLQILGFLNSESAHDGATKSVYIVLLIGLFSTAVYFITRSGSRISKDEKSDKSANSGPDFN